MLDGCSAANRAEIGQLQKASGAVQFAG